MKICRNVRTINTRYLNLQYWKCLHRGYRSVHWSGVILKAVLLLALDHNHELEVQHNQKVLFQRSFKTTKNIIHWDVNMILGQKKDRHQTCKKKQTNKFPCKTTEPWSPFRANPDWLQPSFSKPWRARSWVVESWKDWACTSGVPGWFPKKSVNMAVPKPLV